METTEKKVSHTPGPWTLAMGQGAGREIRAILGPDKKRRDFAEFVLRGDVPVTIFTDVWTQFPSTEWNEMQDANAKLIAAAPDMLQCLKNILYTKPHKESIAAMKQLVESVIKKATE